MLSKKAQQIIITKLDADILREIKVSEDLYTSGMTFDHLRQYCQWHREDKETSLHESSNLNPRTYNL